MAKISTMISVWLWGGIFFFIYLYFKSRKEIKKAKLESIHLCVIFTICCFAGLPVALKEFFLHIFYFKSNFIKNYFL